MLLEPQGMHACALPLLAIPAELRQQICVEQSCDVYSTTTTTTTPPPPPPPLPPPPPPPMQHQQRQQHRGADGALYKHTSTIGASTLCLSCSCRWFTMQGSTMQETRQGARVAFLTWPPCCGWPAGMRASNVGHESELQGANPRRVCLCGANANGCNSRRQAAQKRLTQRKYGRDSASARRHKRRMSIPQPSHGACLRDATPSHLKVDCQSLGEGARTKHRSEDTERWACGQDTEGIGQQIYLEELGGTSRVGCSCREHLDRT
eukprot:356031-Chlamydomonas_euryale.AAC.10